MYDLPPSDMCDGGTDGHPGKERTHCVHKDLAIQVENVPYQGCVKQSAYGSLYGKDLSSSLADLMYIL